jgi:hypothetical protein
MAGSTLSPVDRAPPAEREWAVYSWIASKGWMPALATRSCPSRRPQRAAEMGGKRSFNGLIGAGGDRWWHCEVEHLGGLQINDQLKARRLLGWSVGGHSPLQHLVGERSFRTIKLAQRRPVRQTARPRPPARRSCRSSRPTGVAPGPCPAPQPPLSAGRSSVGSLPAATQVDDITARRSHNILDKPPQRL